MTSGTYRQKAVRALVVAGAISASAVGISVFSILAGFPVLRHLAMAMAHACLRVWATLPDILQIMLGTSVAVGLFSGGVWVLSAGKQWRSTVDALRSLHREAVDLPPRLRTLLARHGLAQRVTVCRSAHAIALTAGLLAPRIMVSTGLIEKLDDDELEAVLLHEQSHLESRDPLYLLLARALATAFFYVPLVRALVQRHQAATELAADEYVIAIQGESLSLSSAILKLLRALPSTVLVNFFTTVADVRLSHLLEREVYLPAVPRRSVLQSIALGVAIMMPVATVYGLAGALTHASFILRCTV